MKSPEDRYVRDFRRAVNDPRSYWPVNAFDSLASAASSPLKRAVTCRLLCRRAERVRGRER